VTTHFLYNRKFSIISGGQYFKNGVLDFGEKDGEGTVDKTYRTVFGWSVAHDGIIYAYNTKNTQEATRRLTLSRFPEVPGLHDGLLNAQRAFIRNNHNFLLYLHSLYSYKFDDFATMAGEIELHINDPHQKRRLRLEAWKELEEGMFPDLTWLRKGLVWYKMKKDEIAKPGKVARMIGDLGVHCSLAGAYFISRFKEGMAKEPVKINGGEMHFCAKPKYSSLKETFDNLINLPTNLRFYFVYFSDDSCIAIRTRDGKVLRYNLDISKCDASHTGALFKSLYTILPAHTHKNLTRLIKQCEAPIEIRACSNARKRVRLRPNEATLYSGSTLTTVANNLANLYLGLSISQSDIRGPKDVIRAAARAGYVITLDECETPEEIQFLKHSPVQDTLGEWQPLLNPGVMFRASGTCRGDLPGRGPLRPRAEQFQKALLRGMYPRQSFPILETMKSSVNHAKTIEYKQIQDKFRYRVTHDTKQEECIVATDEAVFRRYRITPHQLVELQELVRENTFETQIACPALDAILHKDYGLHCKYTLPNPNLNHNS